MYSSLKNVQILVALLKLYGIKHVVISPGNRHVPLVHSLENDEYFQLYSVVDERSASFFAIGMIEKMREPVAIACTSGTAAANYASAVSEAFYQQLPLLVLTADRNNYYKFQQEEQMIPAEHLYRDVCKKEVTLGHIRDEKDFWYYSRICNEALLELVQGEPGPVHINFIVENNYPIFQGIVKFECEQLPEVRKIVRLTMESSVELWKEYAARLQKQKVLIIYGQHGVMTQSERDSIEAFSQMCDCVISVDMLSNYRGSYTMPTFSLCRMINTEEMKELCPDIVITMYANSVSEIKTKLLPLAGKFEHWHVSAKGEVSDPFKCLPDVIACSPDRFFRRMTKLFSKETSDHSYYELWSRYNNRIGKDGSLNEVEVPYSAMYVAQNLVKNIPERSLFHLANSNSVRLANYFILNQGVEVYGNRGTNGIDGSISAFIGQSNLADGLCFLLIGDLSFFYDMNALWNSYIGNNLRIVVCNNSGGAIFHTYPSVANVPTLDDHIAAEHVTSIKAWVEARGFEYLSARDKDEVRTAIARLCDKDSDRPLVLEAFTDKEIDAESIRKILEPYKSKGALTLRKIVSQHTPENVKSIVRKAMGSAR